MTPAEFDQLMQAHLDDPSDATARAAVERAAAEAPALAALLAEYRALDAALVAGRAAALHIDEAAQRVAISGAVDADIAATLADARLNAALAAAPLDGRVNWQRLRERIAAVIDADIDGGATDERDAALGVLLRSAGPPAGVDWERFAASTRRAVYAARRPARPMWRIVRIAGPLGIGLAAAAAWLVMLRPAPPGPAPRDLAAGGSAVARLTAPTAAPAPSAAPALAFAAIDEVGGEPDEDVPTAAAAVAVAQDEFFTIAPVPRAAADAYSDVY